jgi:molybdopterin-guanine dinucleotide biosynthesis protein A
MNSLWAILNGGKSSRFGSPKYLAQWNGQSFVDISRNRIRELGSNTDRIVLSGGPSPDESWEVIEDSPQYAGPLAGLHALLHLALQTQSQVLIIQPIDMPMLQSDHLSSLRDQACSVEGVVVAESQNSSDKHWVLAAVHASRYKEAIAHIEKGTCGSLKNLWAECACEFLTFPDECLANINYPN